MCVRACVRACVRECVRACVRACVCVCVCVCARVRAYACFLLLLLLLDCEEDGTIISVYIMCCLAILSLHGSWNTDVMSLFDVCFSYIYLFLYLLNFIA